MGVFNVSLFKSPLWLKESDLSAPIKGRQAVALATLVGFLSTLLMSLFDTTPASATSISMDITTPNVDMQIPDSGGIVVARQTVSTSTTGAAGHYVNAFAADDGSLVNKADSSDAIKPQSTTNSCGFTYPSPLKDMEWGIATPNAVVGNGGTEFGDVSDYEDGNQELLRTLAFASISQRGVICATSPAGASATFISTDKSSYSTTLYYGVRVDNPSKLASGDYTGNVTYTATAVLPPTPTVTSINPSSTNEMATVYNGSSVTSGTGTPYIVVTGTNLENVEHIWLEQNDDGLYSESEKCNIKVKNASQIECAVPTSSAANEYDIYVQDRYGNITNTTQKFTYNQATPLILSVSPNTIPTRVNNQEITIIGIGLSSDTLFSASSEAYMGNGNYLDICKNGNSADIYTVTCVAPSSNEICEYSGSACLTHYTGYVGDAYIFLSSSNPTLTDPVNVAVLSYYRNYKLATIDSYQPKEYPLSSTSANVINVTLSGELSNVSTVKLVPSDGSGGYPVSFEPIINDLYAYDCKIKTQTSGSIDCVTTISGSQYMDMIKVCDGGIIGGCDGYSICLFDKDGNLVTGSLNSTPYIKKSKSK